MIHFRVVCPPDRSDELVAAITGRSSVINIVRLPGAATQPDGDVFFFDTAPEAANGVLGLLRGLEVDTRGSIALERVDSSLSTAARRAAVDAPGNASEAVIWSDVEDRAYQESGLSPSYVALMVISALIAAVGILTDSPILIVGAMVVGPEFGPISGIVVGLHRGRRARILRGLSSLGVGLAAAIVAVAALAQVVEWGGWSPQPYLSGERPLTRFISAPDKFSVIVAVLAAVAGALSLTQLKAGTLVGVLVSVTTIPAAANVSVALVHGRNGEAGGAAVQLLLNVGLLCVVGAFTLLVERALLDKRHRDAVA